MAFPRKVSQPRDVKFTSSFGPLPDDAPTGMKSWWEDLQATLRDDHQTIEDAFAGLRASLDTVNSERLSAIEARLSALEARPTGTTTTTNNTTIVQEEIAPDELTQDQKDAIQGTYANPSGSNRFVTSLDPRLKKSGTIPVGTIVDFAGTTAPDGWLLCDGSPVDRVVYEDLFSIIEDTFGVGDGSTTFNVPDCRGRSSMGAGTGAGLTARTLADILGEEDHLLTGAESGLPAHNHTVPWRDNSCAGGSDNDTGTMTSGPITTVDTSATGPLDASSPHNSIHPVIVLNRIIKF